MSYNVCRTCKHEPSCTFPRSESIVIVQCEEYEYAEPRTKAKAETTAGQPACAQKATAAR